MNVRKFTAATVGEALAEVRKELGEEAIILRTRTVRQNGMFAFLAKEMVEVMAASPDRNFPPAGASPEQIAEVRRRLETRPSEPSILELKDELNELRGHLKEIAGKVGGKRISNLPDSLVDKYHNLIKSGVEERMANELTEAVLNESHPRDGSSSENHDTELRRMIGKAFKMRTPDKKLQGKARIIAIIGPTGVGKTTTLAKLVTSYRFWGGLNTALVSADTYRVAALEQIKTFASIAGLPMEAVYQPEAMPVALARHLHRDAIFVDTPGRSQSDPQKLDELSAFLTAAETDERLLCLSVNTRPEDQIDVIERYGKLNPTGIIFTKFDDSRHPGGILSVAARCQIPLTYMTCGQNVPDDIVAFDPDLVTDLLLNPISLDGMQEERFKGWISSDEKRFQGGRNA